MIRLTPPPGPTDHAQGPADAPVTLVEYGDYECPYCGEAYAVIKAVQKAMGPRLRFIFRNFPLTQSHPHAARAAELAEAAATIDRFWLAHDILYENQTALETPNLVRYGAHVGLDPSTVVAAFEGRFDARIRADFESGVKSGVNGTPTLFINGLRYDGPRDVQSLLDALTPSAPD